MGRILFGFGGVFFSLTLMSGAMAPLKYLPAFKDVMVSLSGSPILGVFIGTTITVLVQASSATISILQNIYQEGLIPLKAALPVLFGDNIGDNDNSNNSCYRFKYFSQKGLRLRM